jgi:hypothetical protein
MSLILKDRVRETATVVGTGDAALLGAVTGFQAFSVVGNGNTCYYAIADQSGGDWEVGLGTYSTTGPTLARTTVLASSNANAKVVFTGGTKDIFLTYPAEKALQYDASGNLDLDGTVTFTSNGATVLPTGTSAEQPSPASAGMLRFNTDTSQFEGYNGSAWSSVGGAAISNDTSTATYEYPLFASATSGTALTVYTSNANYLYKPSTGEMQAKILTANTPFIKNTTNVTANYTTEAGYNTMSAGPITVDTGVTVTVTSGTVWIVL